MDGYDPEVAKELASHSQPVAVNPLVVAYCPRPAGSQKEVQ